MKLQLDEVTQHLQEGLRRFLCQMELLRLEVSQRNKQLKICRDPNFAKYLTSTHLGAQGRTVKLHCFNIYIYVLFEGIKRPPARGKHQLNRLNCYHYRQSEGNTAPSSVFVCTKLHVFAMMYMIIRLYTVFFYFIHLI